MKETQLQIPLPGVPQAKQGREVPQRWAWTEASVWTERMLATLERGIKGGKWFSLIDKVWKGQSLQSATQQVLRNQGGAGVDGQSCAKFRQHAPERLKRLQEQIKSGTYTPPPVKRVWIPKLGSKELRPLGIPTVEDRVVQTAVRNVIEPIFENTFAEHSYGFRPGRGAKDALRRVDQLLKAGKVWVVDADLKGYLNPLDHLMARAGKEMVRYADDFVVLCQSEAEAQEVLESLRRWVAAAGLTLHPTKTRIVDASQRGGFDFLGYHFKRGHRWPRKKSLDKLRATIREKTRRRDPRPMREIVADVNRTLKGWFNYFGHSVSNVFEREDQHVRQRLRTIQRRGHKLQGCARGRDHQSWPNAFFAELGLISLALSRAEASRPQR